MHGIKVLIIRFTLVLDRGEKGGNTIFLSVLIDSPKMSDVRLSNGSPTLERTDARLSDHPKPSACRIIFGSPDREELRRDLKGHLQEMEAAASAKWNFDFSSHTPLSNGRFKWELMDCKDIPNFYTRTQQSVKDVCPSGNNNMDLNGNHSCVVVTPRQPTDNTERSESQMESKEQCTGRRKRPACYEYPSSQNKRSHSSSNEVTPCPGLTHSVEKTPRKASPRTQT